MILEVKNYIYYFICYLLFKKVIMRKTGSGDKQGYVFLSQFPQCYNTELIYYLFVIVYFKSYNEEIWSGVQRGLCFFLVNIPPVVVLGFKNFSAKKKDNNSKKKSSCNFWETWQQSLDFFVFRFAKIVFVCVWGRV